MPCFFWEFWKFELRCPCLLSCWAVFQDLIQSLKNSMPLERNCKHFHKLACVFCPTGEPICNLPTIMASKHYAYCLCLKLSIYWMFTSEMKNLDSHIAGSPCSWCIPTKTGPTIEVDNKWGRVLDTDGEIPHFNTEGHDTMDWRLVSTWRKLCTKSTSCFLGKFLFPPYLHLLFLNLWEYRHSYTMLRSYKYMCWGHVH